MLRTPAQVAASAADHPFGDEAVNAYGLYIGYTRSAPGASARDAVVALSTENDDLAVHGREVYWLCRTRISDSKITGGRLEKALGMPLTVRNVTTVRKLAEKYAG